MKEPRRVLVADDEPHIRQILVMKLKEAGFEVIACRDGGEALEKATAAAPDLIITDLQMPQINGLELARRLREQAETAQVPVLMLTARGHIVPAAELAKTNIRELFSKPFSARAILEGVQRVLTEPAIQGAQAA